VHSRGNLAKSNATYTCQIAACFVMCSRTCRTFNRQPAVHADGIQHHVILNKLHRCHKTESTNTSEASFVTVRKEYLCIFCRKSNYLSCTTFIFQEGHAKPLIYITEFRRTLTVGHCATSCVSSKHC
jgi:hypothetical protein